MPNWKSLGYVPDSDDEEDIILPPTLTSRDEAEEVDDRPVKAVSRNSDHLTGSSTTSQENINGQTTAEQLEKTLLDGLQLVRDVHAATSPPNETPFLDSLDDSPLSSLSSSIAGSPPILLSRTGSTDLDLQGIDIPQLEIENVTPSTVPRRSLRARAPIQEHPYMLEDAKYRQLMKDRGIKPINIPTVSANVETQQRGEDSQQTEDYQNSLINESFDFDVPSSPVGRHSSQLGIETQELSSLDPRKYEDDLEDGLPDLAQILQERVNTSKRTYQARDRRPRTLNPPSNSLGKGSKSSNEQDHEPFVLPQHQSFRVPPSPPGSDNNDAIEDDDDIILSSRRPRGADTPNALPTPLVSSDNGFRKRRSSVVSVTDSQSDDSVGEDRISRPSSPDDDEDDSQGIQWIRQRLKGILPPSYVKLDIRNQAQNQSRQRNIQKNMKSASERGVARRTLSRPYRLAEKPADDLYQFGEAEASYSDQPDDFTMNDDRSDSSHAPFIVDKDEDVMVLDDVVEVDDIDHMLPPSGIRQKIGKPGRKKIRQQRIDNVWAVSTRQNGDTASVGSISIDKRAPSVQGKDRAIRKRKKLRHKRNPPQISVFDAPGFQDTDHRPPQFLKVAARQAKKANRQSYLSQKVFVLATKEDTHDVNGQLTLWKEMQGKGRQSRLVAGASAPRKTTRPPSHPKHTAQNAPSVENSRIIPTVDPDIADLKLSTRALLSKLSNRSQEIAHQIVEPVDVTTGEDLHAQVSVDHLRSLFAHRNRSGQGRFYSQISKPRTAQVETRRPPSKSTLTLFVQPKRKPDPEADRLRVQSQPKTGNPKKLRKQTPRRSNLPTVAMTSNEKLILSDNLSVHNSARSAQPRLEERDHIIEPRVERWIQAGIVAVKNLRRPSAQLRFSHRSLIGGNTLYALFRFANDESYDFGLSQAPYQPVTTPLSVRVVRCGRYNAIVSEHIFTALDEIYDAFFKSDRERAVPLRPPSKCVQTLEDILTYLEEAAFFQPTIQQTAAEILIEFAQDFDVWLQKFTGSATDQYLQENNELKSLILHCLNRSACLAMRLRFMVRYASLSVSHKLCATGWKIIDRTMEIVFEPEALVKSLERFQNIISESSISISTSGDPQPITIDEKDAFPEVESTLIAWQITFMDRPSWDRFYEQLESILSSAASSHWSAQLALTLMALPFVLPLTEFTLQGMTREESSEERIYGGSCFKLLVARLKDLVAMVPSGQAPALVGQMLEAVEDLSLKLKVQWFITPPPALATALLRVYGWNAMLPFNTLPDVDDIFGDLKCLSLDKQYHVNNDFFKLLDIIEICMEWICDSVTSLEQSIRASRLRAFVFSLIPNNSPRLDARKTLQETQFLALKNHCSLYLCLLTRIPEGFQPHLKQLEQQVDLTESHYRACQVAIAAWKSLAVYRVQRLDTSQEKLQEIKDWMNSMFSQAIVRFTDHQQFDAIALFEELLSTLTNVVDSCETEVDARVLLQGEIFDTIARLLNETELHRNNENVIVAGLQLLRTYVNKVETDQIENTLMLKVQLILRNVIQNTLSHTAVQNAALLRLLMSTWFLVAQAMVRTFHKHWNDFIEPHSILSIDFLSGLRNSFAAYEAKQLFFSELIPADQSFYFLECRPVVFMTWIATLLLPVQSMRFGHILTEPILRYEKDSLMIKDLAAELFKHDGDPKLELKDVADSRVTILRHVIQNIYSQQWDAEEEWLAGGLDPQVQKELLRLMTKTMKANWLDLRRDPIAQGEYTTLCHAVLNEMETYPVQGFKIDSWFTGSGEFPRPKQSLDNIFKCRFGEGGGIVTKEAIRDFQLQYIEALTSDQEDVFLKDMIRVFHCTDRLRSRRKDGRIQYSIDFARQAKFIQVVFPPIIDCARQNPESIITDLILVFLTDVTRRIQFRIDNLNPESMGFHFTTMAVMLYEVSRFLKIASLDHRATPAMLRYVRVAFVSLFALVEYGIEIDESTFEMCMTNILSVYSQIHHLGDPLERREVGDPSVYDSLIESFQFLLTFEPIRPEMGAEEKMLRGYMAEEIKGWEVYVGDEVDEEEVRAEAAAFAREVKQTPLLPREVEEQLEEESWFAE